MVPLSCLCHGHLVYDYLFERYSAESEKFRESADQIYLYVLSSGKPNDRSRNHIVTRMVINLFFIYALQAYYVKRNMDEHVRSHLKDNLVAELFRCNWCSKVSVKGFHIFLLLFFDSSNFISQNFKCLDSLKRHTHIMHKLKTNSALDAIRSVCRICHQVS